jgi:GDSL-like Lipase/Acylhydrolase family
MRRTAPLLAATALAAASVLLTAGPASAGQNPPAQPRVVPSPYVALGDSYSSAAGVMPFVPTAPPACQRSLLNYAHDIDRVTGASLTDVTCSGAKTSDFFSPQAETPPDPRIHPQLDAVTSSTRLVTMTIGGNDENVFVDSFFGCAQVTAATQDVSGHPCQDKYGNTFVDEIRQQTYPNLVKALTAVRTKAPSATVAILGYPEILPETGTLACFAAMPVSVGDVAWLNHEEDVLNSVVRKAAQATGAVFVDTAASSTGHDACQSPARRWIEPAVGPINALPVHPNYKGEANMAAQTLLQLGLLAGRH